MNVKLSEQQLAELERVSQIELGFPHDFFNQEMPQSFIVHELYPPRHGGEPNRSQILLDAIEAYLQHDVDAVNTTSTESTSLAEEQVKAIVNERIQRLREELAPLLGELSA